MEKQNRKNILFNMFSMEFNAIKMTYYRPPEINRDFTGARWHGEG